MSDARTDTNPAIEADKTSGTTPTTGDGFKAITSQEDLNRVLADRLERERAKFADYKDVKAKAAQLDALTEAKKTDEQKLFDRIAALEKANADLTLSTLRKSVQARFGIADEDADLFLTGADDETLTRQAQRLAGRDADRKKTGNVSPREGTNPKAASSDMRDFTRQLFGSA